MVVLVYTQDGIGTLDDWKEKIKDWSKQREEQLRQQWTLAKELCQKRKQRQQEQEREARAREKQPEGKRGAIVKNPPRRKSVGGSDVEEAAALSAFEVELKQIVGHVVDYSSLFLQYESISLSEHLTLTAVGTLPVTADMFY